MLVDLPESYHTFDAKLAAQVEIWVRNSLQIAENNALIVVEMRCTTRDCPPIKTVITRVQADSPTRRYKIHKPLIEITPDDVATLVHIQPKIVSSHR